MSDVSIHMNGAKVAGTHPAPSDCVEDYFALLKPRVMSLVIFTAMTGIILAPGSIHPWLAVIALLCISVGAGASGALNMWYDADIDAKMQRTERRPVPAGRIVPDNALAFGLILATGSVLLLGVAVNWVAAGFLAFTIFFYAVIYTIWLKRSTPQNIVIGGAAGAFPPMIGWTAVTGTIDPHSIALFLIIFLWTPPHFWALALFRSQDYANAGVPMLPVVAGLQATRKQILIYSIIMLPASVLPFLLGYSGVTYLVGACILGAVLVWRAWAVYRDRAGEDGHRAAKRLFGFSILYLFLIYLLLLADRAVTLFFPGGVL